MNLIIDRGNTLVKCAIYDGRTLIFYYRAARLTNDFLSRFLKEFDIKAAITSTVAGVSFDEKLLKQLPQYILLDHRTPVPFENQYETPVTLGRDRLAAVAGARAEFPNRNVLVIDTGTCLTIDFLRADGSYQGGNISPGPSLRFRSMHEGTAALPLVEQPTHPHLIGTTTKSALQSGGYLGCVAEIIGWVALAREHIDDLIVVLSGGDAESFATSIKNEIFVRPDLVLAGLNEILHFNANKT